MIATLQGVVSEKLLGRVVIECGGVGYGVFVAVEEYDRLTLGERAKAYIYEHIREQSHDLFGFMSPESKRLFEQLLEVNGIGPRMALNVLGTGSLEQVRIAISSGDLRTIQTAPGVGKRVAERIIVELKDKVGLIATDTGAWQLGQVSSSDEAVEALITLGYSAADAAGALREVDPALATEKRIKLALQKGRR